MSEPAVAGPSSASADSDPRADEPTHTGSSTDVSSPSVDATPEVPDDSEVAAGDDLDETREAGDPVLDVMAALEAERDGHLLDLQRMTAEFANYRRQADRRTLEVGGRARGDLAERLLPVFDACDLAL